jgi:chromosome segregation ATPase
MKKDITKTYEGFNTRVSNLSKRIEKISGPVKHYQMILTKFQKIQELLQEERSDVLYKISKTERDLNETQNSLKLLEDNELKLKEKVPEIKDFDKWISEQSTALRKLSKSLKDIRLQVKDPEVTE